MSLRSLLTPTLATALAACCAPASAAPSVAEALKLAPIQAAVDYDRPEPAEHADCTLKMEEIDGAKGWVVRGPNRRVLRRFLDTNGDNRVDQWCYYKNNVEVYRDLDADFNSKADQYRWLGAGGARWGVDKDEDGRIDAWKSISPEEISMLVVQALAERDNDAFQTLLLTDRELTELGLSKPKSEQIREKLRRGRNGFAALASRQKVVDKDAKWLHFAGHRPGVIPAGHEGLKQDLYVYDNVAVIVEAKDGHHQIHLGTLLQIGRTWKLIDLPSNLSEGEVASDGFFFRGQRPDLDLAQQSGGVSQRVQTLIADLEKIDKELLATSSATAQARLQEQRADLMERLAESSSSPEDRQTWIRQFADSVSAAVQSGGYAKGVDRLKGLFDKLSKANASRDLQAYVQFRYLSAEYGQSVQDPKADFAKIQSSWLKSLTSFVQRFPASPDAAEAMLQLAIAEEFAGEDQKALRWYAQIVRDFPSADHAKKAAGAKRRLESVGKPIRLTGATTEGRQLDLSSYQGRVVLIHYWATWCGPCKQDLLLLKDLQAKYGRKGLSIVGVNLDNEASQVTAFLKTNRLPWPQLHEAGGLDSRLANELGVFTLPTMLLIDKQGNVANRNVHAGALDAELKKLIP